MTVDNDPFTPIVTPRVLDTLVACPHCSGVVDVTVETHRARIDTISLLWDAFYERGTSIELDLEELRADLESEVLRRVRGTGPVGKFCRGAFNAAPSKDLAAMPLRGRSTQRGG